MNNSNALNWSEYMRMPSQKEIRESNGTAATRSPYLSAWVDVPRGTKYDRITVDIRADHLPRATYCCAANFILDYSELEKRYESVRTEYGIGGYAGLQRNHADPQKYNGILSFWDVFCKTANGREIKIRARQIYPDPASKESFGGEGTGAHALPPYKWEAGKWYNLRLSCMTLVNGNTAIALSVYDYADSSETLLSIFDLGVTNVTFKDSVAVFLENFDRSAAGEVRSMTVRNYRIRKTNGTWVTLSSARCRSSHPDYVGSYAFFAENGAIGFVTTGVPGCAPAKEPEILYFDRF